MPFVTRSPSELASEKLPRFPGISIPFSRTRKSYTVHVLERPPMEVGVAFKHKVKLRGGKWARRHRGYSRYKIKLPWQYFMVRVNRMGAIMDTFIWFAKKKLEDAGGMIFMPPLPNIYPSGHICNGTIKVNLEDPPHERIRKAYEAFWTTPFTEETWPETNRLIPPCFLREAECEIGYGSLCKLLEYWQFHDEEHGEGYQENHGDCSFPWSPYLVINEAMPSWHGTIIASLEKAMEYALAFITPKASDF